MNMPNRQPAHPVVEWLWQFLLAALYLTLGLLNQRLALFDGHASLFWPATGLALGALLLGGRKFLFGATAGSLALNVSAGGSIGLALGLTLANVAGVALGHWLLTRGNQTALRLQSFNEFVRLVLGGVAASALGACLAVASLMLDAHSLPTGFAPALLRWFMGDLLGISLVTTLMLAWQHRTPLPRRQWLETGLLLALCFVIGQALFLDWFQSTLGLLTRGYWMFLLVTWVALRLGVCAVAAVLLMTALQAFTGVLGGTGTFANRNLLTGLNNTWFYLATLSLVGMVLSTYLHQIRRALAELQVKDSALQAAANAIVITDPLGRIEWANQAFSQLSGYSLSEVLGRNPRELVKSGQHEDAFYHAMWRTIVAKHVWQGSLVNRHKSGALHDEEMTITPVLDSQQNISHFVAVKQDITERKRSDVALYDLHQKTAALLNSMAEGAYGVDTVGNCTFVNAAFLRILGYSNVDEVMGRHIHELTHHSHADGSVYPASECLMYRAYQRHENIHCADEVFWHKNGTAVPVEYWSHPIITDGIVTGAIATFIDISNRLAAEAALRQSEFRFNALAVQSGVVTWQVDSQGLYTYVSDVALAVWGYTPVELVGRVYFYELHPQAGREEFKAAVFAGFARQESFSHLENLIVRADGREIWVATNGIPLLNADGSLRGYSGNDTDITERKEREDHVHHLAFYDALTRLPNRRLMNERLGEALVLSKRTGRWGGLMFLDLDNFKPLNDAHGHAVGDLLLIEVAERLKACVREIDTVARFGGDEFVVLLSDLCAAQADSEVQATKVAEKIRASLGQPYHLRLPGTQGVDTLVTHQCTASMGVTVFSHHEANSEDIMKRADAAMYQAKEAGRNTVRLYAAI